MAFRLSQLFGMAGDAFHVVAADIENAAAAVIKALGPDATPFVEEAKSLAKQYASDGLSLVDSYLADHHKAIALAVEQAIDTELSLITHGASAPLNGITNDFLDRLDATAAAAAHNAILSVKARWAMPPVAAQGVPAPAGAATSGVGVSNASTLQYQRAAT